MTAEEEEAALAQRATAAIDTLYATMQAVAHSDPHLWVAMGKHGLIEQIQAVLDATAGLASGLSRVLKEQRAAPPVAPSERAAAVIERIKRDRAIFVQQRADGTMTEAEYVTATRELDALQAQAGEWTC